jgi:tetratricopeptide (TPR) repeat protein
VQTLEHVRERAAAYPELVSRALGQLGMLALERGELELAESQLTSAIERLDGVAGAALEQAWVMFHLATLRSERGELARAAARLEEVCARARALESPRLEGLARVNLATLAFYRGEEAEAEAGLVAALALARRVGDGRAEAGALLNLSFVYRAQGRLDVARAGYEEVLALSQRIGDNATQGVALGNLAELERACGQPSAARARLWEALEIARRRGESRWTCHVLGELATQLVDDASQREEALALLDEAELLACGVEDDGALVRVTLHRAHVLSLSDDPEGATREARRAQALLAAAGVPEEDPLWATARALEEAMS